MNIVISIKNKAEKFLINLSEPEMIEDVNELIGRRQFSNAIHLILEEGRMIDHISEDDVYFSNADLIISEEYAYWNLINNKMVIYKTI